MNKKPTVSILGCGWLGFPLAKLLVSSGFIVKGSTTSPEKINMLQDEGIAPYLVHFKKDHFPGLSDFLLSNILIIAIPPGRTEEKHEAYRSMIKAVTNNHASLKKIIFISSTSVYGELNKTLNEGDVTNPDNVSAKLLIEAETALSDLNGVKTIVVRPSGLIGPKRHPARFFAGKKNIPNGKAPVNIVHVEDVTSILELLILSENATGIYNVCSPHHPQKMEFYTYAAKMSGLELPVFINELKAWKIIEGKRISSELGFKYRYDNLYDALINC